MGNDDLQENVEKVLTEFHQTIFIFQEHDCKCGCRAEITDRSVFSDTSGLHVRMYPCTWHATNWDTYPRKLFHIEKWAYKKAEKYDIPWVKTWDSDFSSLYFTKKTPPYMVKKLNRRWYAILISHFEEEE